jgi:hypothetical protein|tara:strand:- start:18318 stop:18866 length:549 start_codon:yes stop_codon:yes gene_type:complete
MSCDINLGRLEPCKDSVGGITAIYFINYTQGLLDTATFDAEEIITGFDAPLTLFKYELKGANSFEETNENSRENGTSFFTQVGTIVLKKQDPKTRKEMKILSWGRPQVVVEFYNTGVSGDSRYVLAGIENGCETAPSATSGAAMGDLNGYNVVFTGTERTPANFIDPDIIGDTTNTVVVNGL